MEQIEYAFDNNDMMQELRHNARKTIVDSYALKELLPKHTDFLKKITHNESKIGL